MEIKYVFVTCVYVRSLLCHNLIYMSNICICKEFALCILNIYV